eukprot:3489492-Rhodomonas_salina.4
MSGDAHRGRAAVLGQGSGARNRGGGDAEAAKPLSAEAEDVEETANALQKLAISGGNEQPDDPTGSSEHASLGCSACAWAEKAGVGVGELMPASVQVAS